MKYFKIYADKHIPFWHVIKPRMEMEWNETKQNGTNEIHIYS